MDKEVAVTGKQQSFMDESNEIYEKVVSIIEEGVKPLDRLYTGIKQRIELLEMQLKEAQAKAAAYDRLMSGDGCNFIIKDLGILNDDGCLPAPWDKELYPQVYRTTEAIWYAYAESYGIFMEATGKTKQEAIDAWNRRAR